MPATTRDIIHKCTRRDFVTQYGNDMRPRYTIQNQSHSGEMMHDGKTKEGKIITSVIGVDRGFRCTPDAIKKF